MLERHVSIVIEEHMNAFVGNLTKSLIDLNSHFCRFDCRLTAWVLRENLVNEQPTTNHYNLTNRQSRAIDSRLEAFRFRQFQCLLLACLWWGALAIRDRLNEQRLCLGLFVGATGQIDCGGENENRDDETCFHVYIC